jgi:hypothetical protein
MGRRRDRRIWQVRSYYSRVYLTEDDTNSQRDHPRVAVTSHQGVRPIRYRFRLFQLPVSIA